MPYNAVNDLIDQNRDCGDLAETLSLALNEEQCTLDEGLELIQLRVKTISTAKYLAQQRGMSNA